MEWMPKCSFWFWTTPSTGNWAHRWTRFHQWPQGADGVTRLNLGRKGDRGNIGWASDVHSESHPTEELWNSRKKRRDPSCAPQFLFCTFLSIQLIFSSWCFVYVVQFKSEKKNHNPWENRGKIKWFKLKSCPFESKKIVSLRYYVSLNGWECFELLHECVCVCVCSIMKLTIECVSISWVRFFFESCSTSTLFPSCSPGCGSSERVPCLSPRFSSWENTSSEAALQCAHKSVFEIKW